MPNISTRVDQYCISHGYIHEEEYLECDYCNEHKDWISLKYRYYNYGFSKHSYLACKLVQWVPGGMTLTEILKANSAKAVRVWEY